MSQTGCCPSIEVVSQELFHIGPSAKIVLLDCRLSKPLHFRTTDLEYHRQAVILHPFIVQQLAQELGILLCCPPLGLVQPSRQRQPLSQRQQGRQTAKAQRSTPPHRSDRVAHASQQRHHQQHRVGHELPLQLLHESRHDLDCTQATGQGVGAVQQRGCLLQQQREGGLRLSCCQGGETPAHMTASTGQDQTPMATTQNVHGLMHSLQLLVNVGVGSMLGPACLPSITPVKQGCKPFGVPHDM